MTIDMSEFAYVLTCRPVPTNDPRLRVEALHRRVKQDVCLQAFPLQRRCTGGRFLTSGVLLGAEPCS
jgi:hypothetical protein